MEKVSFIFSLLLNIIKTQTIMKILITSLLLATGFAFAQIGTQLGGENSKWTFGGSAGLGGSFGSGGGTTVYLTPKVGYKLTNDFEAGLAGNFSWQNSDYFSSTIVGVGPFANYYIGRSFYLSSLFQQYFINTKDKYYDEKYSSDEAALFLGAGYMQNLGSGVYMQLGVMYNVLYDDQKSVFSSGLVPNVGIVVGL